MGTQPWYERLLRRLEDGESVAFASRDFLVLRLPGLVLCGVLLCSSVSAVAQEASTPDELLTLDQAIAVAQENNRLIKISHQSVLQANDQLLAVRTQRYPRFNIQLTGSYLLTAVHVNFPQGSFGFVNGTPVPNTNSILTTEPEWSALAYVDVYQPLSELYNIHLNVEAAQVAKKLTEEQLRQQRQQIINSVKDAYYGMLQTQSALDAATDNVKFLHELDRTTEQYVAEKTALPYQSTGVKAQLAQADLQVATLQDTLATQKENLNSLMGRDLWIDFRLDAVPQELPEEKNLEAARQAALQNRTEVRQAKIKIDQAVFDRRIQKSQYIPDIGVHYFFFSPFTIQGLPQNVNSLGITFKWDLYDWGYKRHLLDEKQRTIEQSKLNLTETQNQVLLDLDNRFRKLREARATVQVAQLSQQAEREKLQVVLEQYKQKAVLLSNVLNEQAAMAQANTQLQQALASFWTARSDFEKSLGQD